MLQPPLLPHATDGVFSIYGRGLHAPVDVLRESDEGDTSVVIIQHMNVRTEYESVAGA